MATPVVSGISALILEEWRNLNPGEPDLHNAALKALLANSGVDLGHPGPDCRFGFGTVRADAAMAIVPGGVLSCFLETILPSLLSTHARKPASKAIQF